MNTTGRLLVPIEEWDWFVRALYETGFANQFTSNSLDDGLKFKNAYVTAAVRCAPPENKPTKTEIQNCSLYLEAELSILNEVRVVLTLGRIALDAYTEVVRPSRRPAFAHGTFYELGDSLPTLVVSYHPSRQNTQTKRLTWNMWVDVFKRIKEFIELSS